MKTGLTVFSGCLYLVRLSKKRFNRFLRGKAPKIRVEKQVLFSLISTLLRTPSACLVLLVNVLMVVAKRRHPLSRCKIPWYTVLPRTKYQVSVYHVFHCCRHVLVQATSVGNKKQKRAFNLVKLRTSEYVISLSNLQ